MNIDMAALHAIEVDRGISVTELLETIKSALLTAYRHTQGHQNDARIENVKAMTDFTRGYGVYTEPSASAPKPLKAAPHAAQDAVISVPESLREPRVKPGACMPWGDKLATLPAINGDPALVQRIWEDTDALAYLYIWHCLLSF